MFTAPETIKVSLVGSVAFNIEVPLTIKSPFMVTEPVVWIEPVNE